MVEEEKKFGEQRDFKESFEAVMQPVVEWLNGDENKPRTARVTLIYAGAELSQGVACFDSDNSTTH